MNRLLNKFFSKNSVDQRGALPILLIIALVGIGIFLAVSATFSFRSNVFEAFYPKPASQAAGGVSMSFAPTSVQTQQNQEFTVDVNINSGSLGASAVELIVNYDATKLQGVSIVPGAAMTAVLQAGTFNNGKASIIVGSGTTPFRGTGTVARITFRATGNSTTTQLAVDAASQIAAVESNENELGATNTVNIQIGSIATPTPSATPIGASASFNLNKITSGNPTAGSTFQVQLLGRSDLEAANLFVARLNYPVASLEVVSIQALDTATWVETERFFDNAAGRISVIAGVANPGLKTTGTDQLITTITFRAKQAGTATISFANDSFIYRNSDNIDILAGKPSLNVTLAAATPTPTATPVVTPTPTATPAGQPDLVVTDISWSPANPLVGQAVTFSAVIRNQGTASTPNNVIHGVAFMINGQTVTFSDNSTAALAAGASRTVTANGGPNGTSTWMATAGTIPVTANVDDINRMAESNESNNMFTKNMVVGIATPTPTPTVAPTPTPTPTAEKGDGNRDGQINLVDLSILLSNWNRTNPNTQVDMNNDGVVNTFDFSALRNILVARNILRP